MVEANEILEKGEKLEFDWYEYNGMYYRILNDNIIAKTPRLVIEADKKSFRHIGNTGEDIILCIGNFTGWLIGTGIDDVEIFEDGLFICNTTDGLMKELRMGNESLFMADSIYRLEDGNFVGVSNGVHYLVTDGADGISKKPLSKSRIRYNEEDDSYYEFINDGEWRKI